MSAVKIEISPQIKRAEDFFGEIVDMIRQPSRLCNAGTSEVGIENISLWVIERMNEIKNQNEEIARTIRLIASNQNSSLIKEIRLELNKAKVTEIAGEQLLKALFVRPAD